MSLFKARKFGCTLGVVVKCNVLFHVSVCKWVWTWWKSHLKLGLKYDLYMLYFTWHCVFLIKHKNLILQYHCFVSNCKNIKLWAPYSSKLKKINRDFKTVRVNCFSRCYAVISFYICLIRDPSCLWHSLQQSSRSKQILIWYEIRPAIKKDCVFRVTLKWKN